MLCCSSTCTCRPEIFVCALMKKDMYMQVRTNLTALYRFQNSFLEFLISHAGLPRFTTCTKTRLLQLCVVCMHEGFLLLRLQGLVALKREEGRFQMITQRRERKIWELFFAPQKSTRTRRLRMRADRRGAGQMRSWISR